MRAARRTSATNLRQRRRQLGPAGFTLVESMVASVLLSVSVVGVSGTILTSYAHDQESKQQHDAVRSAESLKEELTALPMDPASSSDVGLTDFANYSDTVAGGQASVATASAASTKQAAAAASGGSSSSGSTSSGSSTTTSGGGGLLGGTLGLVGGLVGGLLGGGSNSSGSTGSTSGSGSTSGGTTGSTSGGSTTTTTTVAAADTQAALATPQAAATRTVKVERVAALNGAVASTGPLAIVTIDVVVGGQTVRLRRLVSTTEAAAYTGSAQ